MATNCLSPCLTSTHNGPATTAPVLGHAVPTTQSGDHLQIKFSAALRHRAARAASLLALTLFSAVAQQAFAAPLIIDAFRVRGPSGANDEYIQLYNNSGTSHTVAAISGTGYGVAASDGVTRCSIPNGTVIPSRGHYLCTNSVAYSLASYPAGNSTTATGDATYTTDIPDNAGIALFNNNTAGGSYILANRMDAVGSTSEANTLYKEGTGYPALTPFSIDYSFVRDGCGKGGSITTVGPCPNGAPNVPIDTGNNAADFYFVDTNGTSAGAGQRLGAPGPQNLSSPITGTAPNLMDPLDSCVAKDTPPNIVRDFTSDPANNSTFGTIDARRTFVNNTGAPITRLRFRIADLTTFPAPSGFADLRPRTSTAVVVTVDRPPCGSGTSNVTVQGTTLEQPPSQPNGGGFYSTLSAGTVTLGTPLANGASIDLRFLLGIQQTGIYKFALVPETLPASTAAGTAFEISCNTDGGCPTPAITSIVRVNPNPTSAASVNYTVTFNSSVTGVDAADFTLTTTGVAGASITAVAGSGNTRTITVNTGTGNGTIRLDVVDNDTIIDGLSQPLGGTGAGNGSFTAGEVYNVTKAPPTVSSITRVGASPTGAASVQFNVTFSESVTGVDSSDFTLTTTGVAGASIASVTGSAAAYVVTVNTGTGNGTIRLDVTDDDSIINGASTPLGSAGAGNGNFITGEVYTIDKTIPLVTSITRVNPSPTSAASVQFAVTFSASVTGVDTTDFVLSTTGVAGASITGVAGSGTNYTVTVSAGMLDGTIRLDVNDNDSIVNGLSTPLGGAGAGNGNFTTGEVYVIDRTSPTVTINQAAGQADPSGTSPVNFTVTFSEPVVSFTSANLVIGGTAGATTAVITGGPLVYNVAVSGMTGNGSVTLTMNGGAVTDAAGNTSATSTSADNVVTFVAVVLAPATPVPGLDGRGLGILGLLVMMFGVALRRRYR